MLALQLTTEGVLNEIQLNENGEGQLELLQAGVDGWVQAVDLSADLTLWVNEEGKLNGLPYNPIATRMWEEVFGVGTDIIVGNAVFTGGTGEEGETLGLSEEVANSIREKVAKW